MLEIGKDNSKINPIYYFNEDGYSAHGIWLNDSMFELTFDGEIYIMNIDDFNIENIRTSDELYYDAENVHGKTVKIVTTYFNAFEDDSSFREDNGVWAKFILNIRQILEELEELVS